MYHSNRLESNTQEKRRGGSVGRLTVSKTNDAINAKEDEYDSITLPLQVNGNVLSIDLSGTNNLINTKQDGWITQRTGAPRS
jgi:hypothetical protein